MPSYALVSYVRNPLGEFVEQLRRELHPTMAHMAAHLTILPPRELTGTEEAALEFLEEACGRVVPFRVDFGDVETFLPTTPTVFIEVTEGTSRIANCTIKPVEMDCAARRVGPIYRISRF